MISVNYSLRSFEQRATPTAGRVDLEIFGRRRSTLDLPSRTLRHILSSIQLELCARSRTIRRTSTFTPTTGT